MFLSHYHYINQNVQSNCTIKYTTKLYIGIIIAKFSAVSICSSFIWIIHVVNQAQFLNVTLVSALMSITVIYPVIYHED